jgi:FlaA1/EpsC-like NDP-sugar epimerase
MLQRLLIPILGMPRFIKRGVVLAVDSALCLLTVWLAYYLRIGDWVGMDGNAFWRPWDAAIASLALALPLFIMNGLYRAIFRYSGLAALVAIFKAMAYYMAIYATVFTFIGMQGVPRTVGIIQPILLLVLVVASRLLARFWLGDLYRVQSRGLLLPKVLIYGAGNAGRQLAMAMASNHSMRVAGFLDDDDRLHGHSLNGMFIYNPADLPALVPSLEIKTVLLAIPSANRQRRLEIINGIQRAHVQVRTLPDLSEIAQGRVSLSDIRELDVDELLGRDPVSPNHILLSRNISDKVVLVTGAGGSIGSELCRQILALGPKRLVMFEMNEYALYALNEELVVRAQDMGVECLPVLGTVRETLVLPRFGPLGAVALEAPGMLLAIWLTARWAVRRFAVARMGDRLRMGGLAFAVMMLAEFAGSLALRGMSAGQWLAHFAEPAGFLSLSLFVAFAAMPVVVKG